MTHSNQLREEILAKFLADMDSHVFVKTTDENFDGKESVARDLNPVIEDQEAIIVLKGEWDREDLKEILSSHHTATLLKLKGEIEAERDLARNDCFCADIDGTCNNCSITFALDVVLSKLEGLIDNKG